MTAPWHLLDDRIRGFWDLDRARAGDAEVAADETLLWLPCAYTTAGGAHTEHFAEMYGWDTHFINLGLLAHDRTDLVLGHLQNQLHMIERYGRVLNGNRSYYLTRGQPPVLAASIAAYLAHPAVNEDDAEVTTLIGRGAALLAREHDGYWGADHHVTASGLTRAVDLGDPRLRAELASEAETGLDFTPIFGGDARRCVPLVLNCALARTAEVIADLHERLGSTPAAEHWRAVREARSAAITRLCWDGESLFFFEHDVVAGHQIPVRSLAAYWTMWAGIASPEQAQALVAALPAFRGAGGLTFTDRSAPSPHQDLPVLQWAHPSGWPPMQMVVVEGLQRYGYHQLATEIARDFTDLQVRVHAETGELWERYDVVGGGVDLPVERYPVVPMHGWAAASAAVLGRLAYTERKVAAP
ncbi:trehalase family glycosidase [Pseudactinotalea terrae]|uniref:trehalase family glycosidase n=1 Tax=Pseudactinotalea terrae TaxID=1743262 RepID=UPI0012E30E69|nr:trehalase family glycosidase [Pseudactinotalea terrae]